jgi:hypothetical protein
MKILGWELEIERMGGGGEIWLQNLSVLLLTAMTVIKRNRFNNLGGQDSFRFYWRDHIAVGKTTLTIYWPYYG